MDSVRHARVSELFSAAVELSGDARKQFLDDACGDDDALRREIDDLLERDDRPAVVDQPIVDHTVAADVLGGLPQVNGLPREIGPYEIIGVLGRGGMGTVYKARQRTPSRIVALKVVHAHFISKALSRRIEYEAQVLARLQHEGIAQIFEAGTATVSGMTLPFFAMELIDGYTLIEHARRNNLLPDQRLNLMIRICASVQHAHQQGVIHRDLKPANVLVNQSGQPKVLDFGIARVADSDLKSTTLQTVEGQLVGTVAYMSPEQARGDYTAVDTRSDVYALGVLAFELLTGHLPYDILDKPIAEAARIILDESPQRLSLHNTSYHGDLDTILSKALEKDKERRYESAAAFAADIKRYLADEPIIARRASLAYQLRKFAKRNRGLVTATVAAFALLIIAICGTSYGLIKATRERDEAIKAREELRIAKEATENESAKVTAVNAFLGRLLSSADPFGTSGPESRNITVLEMLDREVAGISESFADQPAIEAAFRSTIGMIYDNLGKYQQAYEQFEIARKLHIQTSSEDSDDAIRATRDLAGVLARFGRLNEATAMFRSAFEKQRKRYGERGSEFAMSAGRYGWALMQSESYAEAEKVVRMSLNAQEEANETDTEVYARTLNNLALATNKLDQPDEAEQLYRMARAALIKLHGPDHASVGMTDNNIASMRKQQGDLAGAAEQFERSAAILRKSLGSKHPTVARIITNLGAVYFDMERYEESVEITREAVAIMHDAVGEEHPEFISTLNNLAYSLYMVEAYEEAAAGYKQVAEFRAAKWGQDDYHGLVPQMNWGRTIARMGRLEEGKATIRRVIDRLREDRGQDDHFTQQSVRAMVRLGVDNNDLELVRQYRAMLDNSDQWSAKLLDETATLVMDEQPN